MSSKCLYLCSFTPLVDASPGKLTGLKNFISRVDPRVGDMVSQGLNTTSESFTDSWYLKVMMMIVMVIIMMMMIVMVIIMMMMIKSIMKECSRHGNDNHSSIIIMMMMMLITATHFL